ncbi:MAG: magnesium/cobalt transporter CorA [Steroidobacteraceae bacterium]
MTIEPCARKPRIEVISFGPHADPTTIERRPLNSIDDLPELPPQHTVRWISVTGLGDATVLRAIGKRFDLHPLALEDIANTTQRPKGETYGNYLFIVTRIPTRFGPTQSGNGASVPGEAADDADQHVEIREGDLVTEPLSICLGEDFVLTFQEGDNDVFEPVRQRLKHGSGRLRTRGADYLVYALIDAAIDAFFPLLEIYGEYLEDLETDVIKSRGIDQMARIHGLKRNLLTARRTVWPQREMLNAIIRDEMSRVSVETKVFLRDCYDHTIQLIDMIETYREITSGLIDMQLASQSNRMNEIMKVLTIIATIFIPLTFIVGVYGMNFDTASHWNMPELKWRYGYPAVWVFMVAIAVGLLVWFKRKGWVGKPRS